MASNDIAIGIDLGTTYSCVGVYENREVKILINEEGNRTTPSVVAFTDYECLVGNAAKNQGGMNPKNTVFDIKRIIGKLWDSKQLMNFPFEVVTKDSKHAVNVQFKNERMLFTPEQISAKVLEKMKSIAETYLGRKVSSAVITVPAYFNQDQRQATKEAAEIAGLKVLRIINEPTAAAVAFGISREFNVNKKVLVYDFGGGTFDVSIVTVRPNFAFEVNATSGNTNLGGSDVDERMMNHFAKMFKKEHGIDISDKPRSKWRLRKACEEAKRALSVKSQEDILVDALHGGIDFEAKMSRSQLEDMCSDLFEETLKYVEQALKEANLKKHDIDEILLVGGSTRIPKVQQMLKTFFNGKSLNNSINPDEAVAYGAAAQAAILSGVRFSSFGRLSIRDVTPLSLGTDVEGNLMSTVISRNTSIPLKQSKTFLTTTDNQTAILFEIYEGERSVSDCNHKLGEFRLDGITPLPRRKAKVDVTFEIDEDGILKVTAVERSTGKQNSVTITKGRLDTANISRMMEEAQIHEKEDKLHRERLGARSELESYACKIRDVIEDNQDRLSSDQIEKLTNAFKKEFTWLDNNKNAPAELFNSRYRDLQSLSETISNLF